MRAGTIKKLTTKIEKAEEALSDVEHVLDEAHEDGEDLGAMPETLRKRALALAEKLEELEGSLREARTFADELEELEVALSDAATALRSAIDG